MKETGIVRRIDDLGRVLIPKEVRRMMGIKDGERMEIFTDGSQIVLRKYDVGASYADQLTAMLEYLADEPDIPTKTREQARALIMQARDVLTEEVEP